MARDYIKEFEAYIYAENQVEPEEEIIIPKGIRGNVPIDDIRDANQVLLYLVIEMSINSLTTAVKHRLDAVRTIVNSPEGLMSIQITMTFFGSNLDMRPFQYGESANFTYEANELQTRLYDAIVESCKNMISQYDTLKPTTKVKGVMLIFTDGEDNSSECYYDVKDVQDYLDELRKRGINYLVASFEGVDMEHLASDFKTEPIIIDNPHKRLMRGG